MRKLIPLTLLTLVFLLAPTSGSATDATAPAKGTPAAAAGTCPDPVETAVGGPIAPGTCSADCGGVGGGSTSCSGTCTIVDRNCANNQRGYVQCNGGAKVYCSQPCSTSCSPTANCTQGPDVSCSGSSCTVVHQNCNFGIRGYVECDGARTYCAFCPIEPICPNQYCQAGACDDDDDCCGQTGDGYCQPWGQCICP